MGENPDNLGWTKKATPFRNSPLWNRFLNIHHRGAIPNIFRVSTFSSASRAADSDGL